MKHLFINILLISALFLVTSCTSTDPVVVEDGVIPTIEDVPRVDDEPQVELAPQVDEVPEMDPEYSRSIGELSSEVSYDTFQTDKSDILKIIAQLDESMKNRNYDAWKDYLTPDSILYWSSRLNLQILATRLPDDDVLLRNLSDYFIRMFIPSRMDRVVNEIRYISTTQVKAVQVQDDTDIIYYEFKKMDGKWLVELPTL